MMKSEHITDNSILGNCNTGMHEDEIESITPTELIEIIDSFAIKTMEYTQKEMGVEMVDIYLSSVKEKDANDIIDALISEVGLSKEKAIYCMNRILMNNGEAILNKIPVYKALHFCKKIDNQNERIVVDIEGMK